MFLTLTTPSDIEVLIDNMKINKGAGPNSIPTKILKDYKSEFSKTLSDMINTSFTTGIFPSALKGKYYSYSYQPISLLSNISKIFEKMMHIRLTSFLNKKRFFQVFNLAFKIIILQTMPLLLSVKWSNQHLTMISSCVVYLSTYRKHLILWSTKSYLRWITME